MTDPFAHIRFLIAQIKTGRTVGPKQHALLAIEVTLAEIEKKFRALEDQVRRANSDAEQADQPVEHGVDDDGPEPVQHVDPPEGR